MAKPSADPYNHLNHQEETRTLPDDGRLPSASSLKAALTARKACDDRLQNNAGCTPFRCWPCHLSSGLKQPANHGDSFR